jgi:hypothetical protein
MGDVRLSGDSMDFFSPRRYGIRRIDRAIFQLLRRRTVLRRVHIKWRHLSTPAAKAQAQTSTPPERIFRSVGPAASF